MPSENVVEDWLAFSQHLCVPAVIVYLPGAHQWYVRIRHSAEQRRYTHLLLLEENDKFEMQRRRSNVFVHRCGKTTWLVDALVVLGAMRAQFIRSDDFWLGHHKPPCVVFIGSQAEGFDMKLMCERANVEFGGHFDRAHDFVAWLAQRTVTVTTSKAVEEQPGKSTPGWQLFAD